MNWEELYNGYLSRCKSNPLNFSEFVRLREGILRNKQLEENKKEWFDMKVGFSNEK
jgi:hypothetical protein